MSIETQGEKPVSSAAEEATTLATVPAEPSPDTDALKAYFEPGGPPLVRESILVGGSVCRSSCNETCRYAAHRSSFDKPGAARKRA